MSEPELGANDICSHCDMEITRERVRTGREFFGPFWRDGWTHDHSGEERCWSPCATPGGKREQG